MATTFDPSGGKPMEKLFSMLPAVGKRLLVRPPIYYALAAATLVAIWSASALGLSAQAQAQTGSTVVRGVPNVVLVHGAWADGSSWRAVIQRLQAAGYNVTAPQLPETSLADDVARVREVLASQTGPTLLVAHSYGGEVISALGKDTPNVVGLVYVAAFALDKGESLAALSSQGPPMPSAAAVRPDARGFLYLTQDGYLKYFAPDVDPVQAKAMYAAQQPLAASIFTQTVGEPAWKSLPSWYLVTTDDQMIAPAAQMFLAQRMKATVSTVASSHVAMVSHPDVVANLIESAASSLIPDPRPNTTATPTAPAQATPSIPGTGSETFPQTGKTVSGIFLDYWNKNGGLAQQGYPISDLMTEKSPLDGKTYAVQYFERAVFEYHPENQPPYNVLLSQLGTFRYKQLYGGNSGR
jgi:pimeloyl-ACP methyl ester carboxylesterase